MLSTSKAFCEWGEVFPHAACVVTVVHRLIHRAEVIEVDVDSYRLKEAKELTAARSRHRGKKPASLMPTVPVNFTAQEARLHR